MELGGVQSVELTYQNLAFKSGSMVKHPNINEAIRVKSSNEVVTVVERINQPMFESKDSRKPLGTMCFPVYIVSTGSLLLIH